MQSVISEACVDSEIEKCLSGDTRCMLEIVIVVMSMALSMSYVVCLYLDNRIL